MGNFNFILISFRDQIYSTGFKWNICLGIVLSLDLCKDI